MVKNKKNYSSFRLFLKSAYITALCLLLVAIGFFGAAFFSGGFN